MHCENCGKNIDPDAKFCKHCGHKTPTKNNSPKKKNNHKGFKVFLLILLAISVIFLLTRINSTNNVTRKADTSSTRLCNRNQPYDNPPEFERALSLLSQRQQESGFYPNGWTDLYKCIRVQYQDLADSGAEGVFLFDKNSSKDNLQIYVDNSYKVNDDLLTASLLSHEATHARQLYDLITKEREISCFEAEREAFKQQMIFLFLILNEEERKSIQSRISFQPKENLAYGNIVILWEINNKAGFNALKKYPYNPKENSEYAKAYWVMADIDLDSLVKNNPFYQKECAGK